MPTPLEARLTQEIKDLKAAVRDLTARANSVPVLAEDPGPEDGVNLWLLNDGRLRGYRRSDNTVVEYSYSTHAHPGVAGSAQGGGISTMPAPADEYEPTSERYEEGSDWAVSFQNDGESARPDSNRLRFGFSGNGAIGEEMSMVHFPNLSELAPGPEGTRISGVWVRMHIADTFGVAGEIRIGVHNQDLEPSSFSETEAAVVAPVREGDMMDIQLPDWVGERMRDGLVKGITLNQNSKARSKYGSVTADPAMRPVLIIEYVK